MSGGSADIRLGDVVSRSAVDRHRVTWTNASEGRSPDLIRCVCFVPPLGLVGEDGKRGGGWCVEGDESEFCADDVELIRRGSDLR